MKQEFASMASSGDRVRQERQLIQVDFPPAHAGIVSALRRAFDETPCGGTGDGDPFADLLEKLN